jgi:hypothetical protein
VGFGVSCVGVGVGVGGWGEYGAGSLGAVVNGDVLRECACYGCVPCKAGVSGLPIRLQRSDCVRYA